MKDVIGHGVYTFSDAAKLAKLRPARVREWFVPKKGNKDSVFKSDYGDNSAISFLDLIEVYVAGQLRERGVSLQTIRRIHSNLALRMITPHPFAHRELRTQGRYVFVIGLDSEGREEIYDALTRQKAFPEVIQPFLKQLDYEAESLLASRWKIAHGVVVDPGICFGQPIIRRSSIPTDILSKAYYANGEDAKTVARWYGITTEEVQSAVDFERSLAA